MTFEFSARLTRRFGRQLSREEAEGALVAYERLLEVFGPAEPDEAGNSWRSWVGRRVEELRGLLGTIEHTDPADHMSNRPADEDAK